MREKELLELLGADDDIMQILRVIASLKLRDSWLAAGTVRNFMWNICSHRPAFDTQTDVDVVFFDQTFSYEETKAREKALQIAYPAYRWELKNQVDMHSHSPNTAAYISAKDAISKYPETCTAIAVRLIDGRLELYAPYGLDDIIKFKVRPTPHFMADEERMQVYRERLAKKSWFETWPLLERLV